MKKQTVTRITSFSVLLGVCLASGVVALMGINKGVKPAHAYTAKSVTSIKNIDLNAVSDEDVRSYYSALDSLSEDERKGTNLLKNLKPILKNNQQYFKYDGGSLWAMYEITDRDWEKSPASAIPGYDASTNKITNYAYGSSATNPGTNPYIHALYVRRTDTNLMHAWARESDSTVSHGNNKEWGIDQEHIWAKSQGFNADGAGGARGDPMHLWPGDSDVNSSLHNDQMYGFVNITSSTKHGKWSYATDNYVGTSLTLGTTVSSEDVFEPQDSDKGDIARAIFYLVARYNFLSGEDPDGITSDNPNLEIVQDNTVRAGYTSTTTNTGKQGILTDLLEWHHLDPVDEFEIHRNDILYRNYTFNRNPFIDFPDWVDYIWGTATYDGRNYQSYDATPTGFANRNTDSLHIFASDDKEVSKIEITKMPDKTTYKVGEAFDKTGMVVTATFVDNTTADVTAKCSFTVDMKSAGEKVVTVTYKDKTAKFNITVNELPWYQRPIPGTPIPIIVVIIAVPIIIIVIVLIAVGVLKVNKKGKLKVNKSGVKKIVKGNSSKKKTKK